MLRFSIAMTLASLTALAAGLTPTQQQAFDACMAQRGVRAPGAAANVTSEQKAAAVERCKPPNIGPGLEERQKCLQAAGVVTSSVASGAEQAAAMQTCRTQAMKSP